MGFSDWPLADITPKTTGTVLFGGKQTFSCKIDVSLLNEKNKTLSKSSITLNSERIELTSPSVKITNSVIGTVNFPNIKAEDLTPSLTIVIDAVNGINARNLNASGYMKIETGDLDKRKNEREVASLVRVEGGTFQMGTASGGNNDERPVYVVTIKTFYMGKYEVTQKEWKEVMGNNPSYFKGDNLPVENVSWLDAIEYCNKRSQMEGFTPVYRGSGNNITCDWNANGYRLPTEAEWEFAAKGGKNNSTVEYSGSNNVGAVSWYSDNSGNKTHQVGTKEPNSLGLYDMSGNVFEWCWDWYGNYSSSAQIDPKGPVSGVSRVIRGGGWGNAATGVRSAYRFDGTPSFRSGSVGLRLVRSSL